MHSGSSVTRNCSKSRTARSTNGIDPGLCPTACIERAEDTAYETHLCIITAWCGKASSGGRSYAWRVLCSLGRCYAYGAEAMLAPCPQKRGKFPSPNSSEISYSVHKEVRNWSTRWNHAWKSLYFRWNQNSVIHSQWGRPRKGSHLTKVILSSPVRTDRKEKEGVGTTISSLYLLRSGRATLSLLDQDQEPYRFFLHWVGYIYTSLYSITESPLTTHGMLFHAYKNHRQAGHHPCCLLGDETIHLPWFI